MLTTLHSTIVVQWVYYILPFQLSSQLGCCKGVPKKACFSPADTYWPAHCFYESLWSRLIPGQMLESLKIESKKRRGRSDLCSSEPWSQPLWIRYIAQSSQKTTSSLCLHLNQLLEAPKQQETQAISPWCQCLYHYHLALGDYPW